MQAYLRNNFSQRLKNKSIILFFLPALPNESLTSWICRNALSNYLDPHYFIIRWIKTHSAWHHDFDLKPNLEIISWLIEMSPKRSNSEAPTLFLNEIITGFNLSKTKYIPILKLGTNLHQKSFPSQYCPICLKKPNPYFKVDWKFSLIFGCNECRCFLETNCPKCGSNAQIIKLKSRFNDRFNSLNVCPFCYSFLNHVKPKFLNPEQIEINFWVTKILGLQNNTKVNSTKASLLIDLCILLTSNSELSNCVKDYFQIDSKSEAFFSMNNVNRSKIIAVAKDWMHDFYRITTKINDTYNLKRKNWDAHIFIPESILNP